MSLEIIVQMSATIVTAIATAVLAVVTWVLAVETRRLSEATSRPSVIATIEPNQWSMRYADIRIENTGNAAAFNVSINIDPEIIQMGGRVKEKEMIKLIDVLRPGQNIISCRAEAGDVVQNKYSIKINWSKKPNSKKFESVSYEIDMKKMKSIARINSETPFHQIAEEVKKLRDDWMPLAHGKKRLEVDNFDRDDRISERADLERSYNEYMDSKNLNAESRENLAGDDQKNG